MVLLRRDRIRGAALGPSQRLIGTTLLGFLVLALTPTKWTHHFGAFAALGAGMAALTALATSSDVLRSRRNRSLFLAAVFATLALAFTGPNTWWYTNNWGVPWNDKPPSYNGYQASTLLLAVAGVFLIVAAFEHLRGIPEERKGVPGAPQSPFDAVARPGPGADRAGARLAVGQRGRTPGAGPAGRLRTDRGDLRGAGALPDGVDGQGDRQAVGQLLPRRRRAAQRVLVLVRARRPRAGRGQPGGRGPAARRPR